MQDFTLSRTKQNWRRLVAVLSSLKPLVQWWKLVRSWQVPGLSASVAVGVVLWACFPWRGTSLVLLVLSLILHLGRIGRLGDKIGLPLAMAEDIAADDADDGSHQQQQQARRVTVTSNGGDGWGGDKGDTKGGDKGETAALSGAAVVSGSTVPTAASSSSFASTTLTAVMGTSPPLSPTSSSAAGGAHRLSDRLSDMISSNATTFSSTVPLDTLDSLKSQYESVVGFLALVGVRARECVCHKGLRESGCRRPSCLEKDTA